jgi:hypothetical protein
VDVQQAYLAMDTVGHAAMVGASAANLLCKARVAVAQVGYFVVLMSATMHDVLMGAAAATESSTAVLVMDIRVIRVITLYIHINSL